MQREASAVGDEWRYAAKGTLRVQPGRTQGRGDADQELLGGQSFPNDVPPARTALNQFHQHTMRGVSFKPQDAEDFSTGEIKSYGGIYAATAEDFAGAFEMDPAEFIETVQTSDITPLTEVGDDEEPGKYSLSFERDEFEKLKNILMEGTTHDQ